MYKKLRAAISILVLLVPLAQAGEPLQLDPQNPHYYRFRGKTHNPDHFGEHYGAVINLDFDYLAYLNELARQHLRLTRPWIGSYRELRRDYDPKKGPYAIDRNTLAPNDNRFLAPWQGADETFDLSHWNPKYSARLKHFLKQASMRGIIVDASATIPTPIVLSPALTIFYSYIDTPFKPVQIQIYFLRKPKK